MISECLHDINKPTQINTYYNQETPYKYPPIMICPDEKREQHNNDVSRHYLDARLLDDCGSVFNVRNLNDSGLLQAGYSRNIDLDSELKRINHYDDKCFYDNFKVDPRDYVNDKCSGLGRNSNLLVKDYQPVGKDYSNYGQKLPCMEIDATNPNSPDKFNWDKHVYPVDKCANFKPFNNAQTPVPKKDYLIDRLNLEKNNVPNYYQFQQHDMCNNYPPQRLFYNFTKRKTMPNFHNLQSTDPIYLGDLN